MINQTEKNVNIYMYIPVHRLVIADLEKSVVFSVQGLIGQKHCILIDFARVWWPCSAQRPRDLHVSDVMFLCKLANDSAENVILDPRALWQNND